MLIRATLIFNKSAAHTKRCSDTYGSSILKETKMKNNFLLLLDSLCSVSLIGCQTTGDVKASNVGDVQKVSITKMAQNGELSGRWKSKVDNSWGGGLDIYIEPNEGSSAFKGKLMFSQSGCPWKAPFDGTVSESGQIVLKANPGGKCGNVIITGTFKDGLLTGTYEAEYPDNGTISLN